MPRHRSFRPGYQDFSYLPATRPEPLSTRHRQLAGIIRRDDVDAMKAQLRDCEMTLALHTIQGLFDDLKAVTARHASVEMLRLLRASPATLPPIAGFLVKGARTGRGDLVRFAHDNLLTSTDWMLFDRASTEYLRRAIVHCRPGAAPALFDLLKTLVEMTPTEMFLNLRILHQPFDIKVASALWMAGTSVKEAALGEQPDFIRAHLERLVGMEGSAHRRFSANILEPDPVDLLGRSPYGKFHGASVGVLPEWLAETEAARALAILRLRVTCPL